MPERQKIGRERYGHWDCGTERLREETREAGCGSSPGSASRRVTAGANNGRWARVAEEHSGFEPEQQGAGCTTIPVTYGRCTSAIGATAGTRLVRRRART